MKIPSEGHWKSSRGSVYKHNEHEGPDAFQKWDEHRRDWISSSYPGAGPWTPCEDPSVDKEPRTLGVEVRRWLVENPLREVIERDGGWSIRWHPEHFRFEKKWGETGSWLSACHPRGSSLYPVVPVGEEGWQCPQK